MTGKVKGYVLGMVAAATYGMNPLFALPLYADGMNAEGILFFRYLFALPMMWLIARRRGGQLWVGRRAMVSLGALGLVFALSSLTLFLSYNYMDAGIASSLLFVYPIMVAVIMTCVFGERLRLSTVGCILMALGGIWMLYNGEGEATLSVAGTALVFLSSLSYAVYLVYINRSGLGKVPTSVVTFYVLLFGWGLFVAMAVYDGGITVPATPWLWGNLLGLALFPTAISLLCTTRAIYYIGSTPTAILGALEPVTAVIIGVTVFGEQLTLREIGGIVLIVVAVSFVVANKT